MQKKQLGLAALAILGLAVAGVASAAPVTMTFDEVQLDSIAGGQFVADYYDGGCGASFNNGSVTCGGPDWGVVWTGAAVVRGGPTLSNMPSAPNAIVPSVPVGIAGTNPNMVMDVANGFTSGFSFYYASRDSDAFVTIYSGVDGTGDILATSQLPENSPTLCNGGAGIFHCWNLIDDLVFSGTARSVVFGGNYNNVAYDNISFDLMAAPPVGVPEPGALGMFGFGALLIAGGAMLGRRRRIDAA